VTTYTVQDLTTGLAVPPPVPPALSTPIVFQSGAPITFDGVTFDVKGVPANGDTFSVAPSTKQSLFTTVTNLITALRSTTASTPAGKAAYTSALADASNNLGASLDKVLGVRSSVGSNLKELDYLDTTGSDADIQYSDTLSQLQDLDMVKAISQFSQQQSCY
jgi:flagellar hook-associated protein 3 FlgL